MAHKQLTDAMVEKLSPPATGRMEIFDAIVPKMALRVTASGAKTFVVRGRVKGQKNPIRVTIGKPGMGVKAAREVASKALALMESGIDPTEAREADLAAQRARQAEEERQRLADAYTFRLMIAEWSGEHLATRRPRYAAEAVRALRTSLPQLLDMPAAKLTLDDARAAVRRIQRQGKPVAAARAAAYGRSCFSWAVTEGKLKDNPFTALKITGGNPERERVLEEVELRDVWQAASKLAYPWGPFHQILMLTLLRRSEVAGMRWSELATDLTKWTIPGARMKAGRPHEVHLSEPARDILRGLPRFTDSDLAFTTGRRRGGADKTPAPVSGFGKGKARLDAAITKLRGEPMAPWVAHDFRRTGVTCLARLGFDSVIVDKLLAHQPSKLKGVAGVYQRHEFTTERAQALDTWARFVVGVEGDNVTELRRSTA